MSFGRFGVVCAFATDSQLETSASEAPASVKAGLRDARSYLNATQAHARWLLVNNYQELEHKLNGLLSSAYCSMYTHTEYGHRVWNITFSYRGRHQNL